MASILEIVMLVCFGCSWPLNLMKNIKAKSAKNMSLSFILLISFGYIAGLTSKFIIYADTGNINLFVVAVYILNLVMVSSNIVVYIINKKFDKENVK